MNETDEVAAPRLDGVLSWNFTRAARLVGNRMAEQIAGHGLNPIQFGVLAFLAQETELTTSQIARAVYLRPQSIAPLLDHLAERGLVVRTGSRDKGRRNPVQITAAGRTALDEVWVTVEAADDLTEAGLTHSESRELNRLLLKVITSGL